MDAEIRSSDGLIVYARSHVSSRACERAFADGRVEVLGGFDPLLPSASPGWIVRVQSKYGRVWLVGVIAELSRNRRYRLLELDTIPWQNWVGRTDRSPTLYDGADPQRYAAYREKHNGC